jgi:hypothetical protein
MNRSQADLEDLHKLAADQAELLREGKETAWLGPD